MDKIDINIHSVLQPTHQAICADLLTGRFKPGERLPGERELARLYGIGRSSMVKVLKQLELERYVERVPVYGTFVRRDINKRVDPLTITVASMDTPEQDSVSSPFAWEATSEILRGLIYESSQHRGIHLNWHCCPDSDDEEVLQHQIEDLLEADAIIFNGCGMDSLKEEMFRRGKPSVTLGPKLFYRREPLTVVDYDRWNIFPEYPAWLLKKYPNRPVILVERNTAECDKQELQQYKKLFLEGFGRFGVTAQEVLLSCASDNFITLFEAIQADISSLQLDKEPLLVALNRSLVPPLCTLLRKEAPAAQLAALIGGTAIEGLHADIPHWREPYFEMGSVAVRLLVEGLRRKKKISDSIIPMHFSEI